MMSSNAILIKLVSVMRFAIMVGAGRWWATACRSAKWCSSASPSRSAVSAVLCLARRADGGGAHRRPFGHAGRGLIAWPHVLNFAALPGLPLADVPCAVLRGAAVNWGARALILKYVCGVYRWTAVGVGFAACW